MAVDVSPSEVPEVVVLVLIMLELLAVEVDVPLVVILVTRDVTPSDVPANVVDELPCVVELAGAEDVDVDRLLILVPSSEVPVTEVEDVS